MNTLGIDPTSEDPADFARVLLANLAEGTQQVLVTATLARNLAELIRGVVEAASARRGRLTSEELELLRETVRDLPDLEAFVRSAEVAHGLAAEAMRKVRGEHVQ